MSGDPCLTRAHFLRFRISREKTCVPHSVPASNSGSVSGDRCTSTYTNITTVPPWYLPLLIHVRKEGLPSLGMPTMVVLCLCVCCCNSRTLEIYPYLQYICKFLGVAGFVWRVRDVTGHEGKCLSGVGLSACALCMTASEWNRGGGSGAEAETQTSKKHRNICWVFIPEHHNRCFECFHMTAAEFKAKIIVIVCINVTSNIRHI